MFDEVALEQGLATSFVRVGRSCPY